MTTLHLPYPPSVNRIWRNVGPRTLKSKVYRDWLAEGWAMVKAQAPKPVLGRYCLNVVAFRPDRRDRDLDNIIKPISDLLTACGVIEDDHMADRINIEWSDTEPSKGAGVVVRVSPSRGDNG